MRLSLILALASSAASAFAADQRVVVGLNGTLVFSPANFTSSVGDTVTFEFHARNHTVTQSTFSSPCTPSLNASSGTVVNSGFIPVAANATTFPTYTITINETSPLWFFCAQEPHCEKGMVGAVNAPTTGNNTYAAFLAKALALGTTTSNSTSTVPTTTSTASSTPKSGALPKLSSAESVVFVSLVGVAMGVGLIL